MGDVIKHANGVDGEVLTGRKLANAMNLLLSDLADAIDEHFPPAEKSPEGQPDSAEYIANAEAHAAAYTLMGAVLLGQPADTLHRERMWEFAKDAFKLYGGRTDDDEVVRKCIRRAADDYKPETPEQTKRSGKAKRTAALPAATSKASSK